MIKINLLPFKRKRATSIGKDIRDLAILLVLGCIGFGIYYIGLNNKIDDCKSSIRDGEKKIEALKPFQTEYLQIQNAKKEIQKRLQTLKKLQTGRALAARSFYDLASSIKEGVWLKSIKKNSDKFEMEGRSFVNESISDFIEMLSKLPYIRSVELKSIQDVNEEGLTIKKFIITGNMSI